MPGTTQVPCHSGPGVRLHSWWMESFLTLILLILVLILVLGLNLRLSVVLMMNLFFLIFVRQIPKVIQRPTSLFPNTIDIEKNLQCTGEEKFEIAPQIQSFL